jgi:hypothetical protein
LGSKVFKGLGNDCGGDDWVSILFKAFRMELNGYSSHFIS